MSHSAEFCFYTHGKLEYRVGITNNAVDANSLYNNTIRTADEMSLYWDLHQWRNLPCTTVFIMCYIYLWGKF